MALQNAFKQTNFPLKYSKILQRVDNIDAIAYGSTRNYIDGSVSFLSPYISRGVISTKFVLQHLLNSRKSVKKIEKFIQELAWRDYWQQIWIAKGELINSDLKNTQYDVDNFEISRSLVDAKTGIQAIDDAILSFYQTGYLHNHLRMYIAAISCNMAKSHWKIPAKWMYYYLIDADWASNALSWQWVAGSNSNKKYMANQENINKFCRTQQKGTFLDIPYEDFKSLKIPQVLSETLTPKLITPLPKRKRLNIDSGLPTLIYNYYNLDPLWKSDILANRILLLEPSHYAALPISKKSMDFVLALGANIKNLQVYVGEFNELMTDYSINEVHYKEHPTNKNYKGNEEPRDWMFDVWGYYPSFFSFWKKCKKELRY